MTHSFKTTFLIAATALSATALPSVSFAQDTTIGIDYVTEYVFRGVSFADEAIQPYVETSFGDLTVGVWASIATGDGKDVAGDEIDIYASYSIPVNSEAYTLDAGVTYYHFPSGGSLFATDGGSAGTYEASLSAGFNAPFEPSLTAYYDLTLEAFTLEGGLSHSIPVTDVFSLDTGLTAGLVEGDGGVSYQYGSLSASLGYALSDTVSAYVGGNAVISSDETLDFKRQLTTNGDKSHLWFGAGFSAGF